jgi:aquaporin related protein
MMPERSGVVDPVERRKLGMTHPVRNEVIAAFAEFCGTFMFLFLAFAATQAVLRTRDGAPMDAATLLFISGAFGGAIAANVWAFYRVCGGMFNPAVTLGLVLVGAITPIRGIVVFIPQLVAGIAAAAVVDGLIPGPLLVRNSLGDGVSVVQGLFLEMFLTANLVFVVYMLAVEKHRATYIAPLGIGIAVFMCHMVGVSLTGTSVNPVRSFGPAVIAGFHGYDWIYWVGPFLGSLLAFAVFKILSWLNYSTVNAGQDEDGLGAYRFSADNMPNGARQDKTLV